jgi:hypothetical protein
MAAAGVGRVQTLAPSLVLLVATVKETLYEQLLLAFVDYHNCTELTEWYQTSVWTPKSTRNLEDPGDPCGSHQVVAVGLASYSRWEHSVAEEH